MLFFLQIPESLDPVVGVGKDALERAWEVTPTTIYGLLLGLLLLAVIYLLYKITRKDKDLKEANKHLLELNISNVEVLKDLNTSLLLLKEEGTKVGEAMKEQIDFTRGHIISEISKIEAYVKKT